MSLICDCCGRGFRGSVEIPEHDCAAHPTPSVPKPPRPAYGDPSPVTEGWDDDHDRAIYDSVGWDLAFGCTIAIGHEHAYDGDPEQWTAGVALSDEQLRSAGCHRTVTPAQVEDYARQLLALVARHRPTLEAPAAPAVPQVHPDGSVYVRIQPKTYPRVHRTQQLLDSAGVMVAVDLDEDGAVLGVEILGALAVEVEGRSAWPTSPDAPAGPSTADLLRRAAAGRREYAGKDPSTPGHDDLLAEASTLDLAARLADGDLTPSVSAAAHWCGWCGGDELPDGQPCPTIDLGHEPEGDEAEDLRGYYQEFEAHGGAR